MKKSGLFFALLFSFLIIVSFAGCAEKKSLAGVETSTKETETATVALYDEAGPVDELDEGVVLLDVLNAINKEFSISEDSMMAIEDTDSLEIFYNILPADVKQFAAETTINTATDITEIILVEAVNSDAASRVYDALDIRYNSQRDLCASYSPELVSVIDKCSVTQDGNFVTLIMSNDTEYITEYYNSLVK